MQDFGGGLVAIKNGVHAVENGGAGSDGLGGLIDGKGVGHSFGNHAETGFGFGGGFAFGERDARPDGCGNA